MGTLRGQSHIYPRHTLTYQWDSVTSVWHDILNHVHKHSERQQNRDAWKRQYAEKQKTTHWKLPNILKNINYPFSQHFIGFEHLSPQNAYNICI